MIQLLNWKSCGEVSTVSHLFNRAWIHQVWLQQQKLVQIQFWHLKNFLMKSYSKCLTTLILMISLFVPMSHEESAKFAMICNCGIKKLLVSLLKIIISTAICFSSQNSNSWQNLANIPQPYNHLYAIYYRARIWNLLFIIQDGNRIIQEFRLEKQINFNPVVICKRKMSTNKVFYPKKQYLLFRVHQVVITRNE